MSRSLSWSQSRTKPGADPWSWSGSRHISGPGPGLGTGPGSGQLCWFRHTVLLIVLSPISHTHFIKKFNLLPDWLLKVKRKPSVMPGPSTTTSYIYFDQKLNMKIAENKGITMASCKPAW